MQCSNANVTSAQPSLPSSSTTHQPPQIITQDRKDPTQPIHPSIISTPLLSPPLTPAFTPLPPHLAGPSPNNPFKSSGPKLIGNNYPTHTRTQHSAILQNDTHRHFAIRVREVSEATYLFERPDDAVAVLVVHVDGHGEGAEFTDARGVVRWGCLV